MIGIQHKNKPVQSHGFAIIVTGDNPHLFIEIMRAMGEDYQAYSLLPLEFDAKKGYYVPATTEKGLICSKV